MYCLKCRRVTETENIATVTSKNGRLMRRDQCVTCGKINCEFVKKEVAGGIFLNSLLNKLPFEMPLPGHNFTGSGTKLNKRLNPYGTPKEWSMPINRVDNAAYHYDLCYSKHGDTKTRIEVCDKSILGELSGIFNPTLRERIDKSIVGKLIRAKVNIGLGAPIKAKKKFKIYRWPCKWTL